MECAQVFVAVNQPQDALVSISELGVVLLPIQGTLGIHDALACKRDDTLRLSLLCIEAEPMPCRHRFQNDHYGADVVDNVIWVSSNGENCMVVDPSGTIQVYLTFLFPSKFFMRTKSPSFDQALTQFLDKTRHARVENQISKWVTRANPRNAEREKRYVHASP